VTAGAAPKCSHFFLCVYTLQIHSVLPRQWKGGSYVTAGAAPKCSHFFLCVYTLQIHSVLPRQWKGGTYVTGCLGASVDLSHWKDVVDLYSPCMSMEEVAVRRAVLCWVTRVTRMAYSPRLWLMAIGW